VARGFTGTLMRATRRDKVVERWRSDRLQREVTLARWGSFGQPVIMFPTAGGDAEEIERWQMIEVLGPLLDAGKIKLYSCDSVAGKALIDQEGGPHHLMWIQNMFQQYVRHEVVPAIRKDCKVPEIELWAAGASWGAFHAVAVQCRWPDVFAKTLAMSGTYELKRFFGTDDLSEDFVVSSPLHFMHLLGGRHLEVLRTRYIHLASGEGRAEALWESWWMANALGRQGVPNQVDSWGPQYPHDWLTWRAMMPQILGEWTAG
jgi:esterase/lipase superfamily enzyme